MNVIGCWSLRLPVKLLLKDASALQTYTLWEVSVQKMPERVRQRTIPVGAGTSIYTCAYSLRC